MLSACVFLFFSLYNTILYLSVMWPGPLENSAHLQKGKLWTTFSPLCVFCEANRPVLAVFSVASVVEDLRAALSKLECRVAVLEKSPAAVTPAASTCSVPYTNVRLYLLISAQIFPALLLSAPVRFLWFFLTLIRAPASSRRAALQ